MTGLGRIDILHNNVGVTHMGGPVELSEEQFAVGDGLNIGPVFRTAKAVIPHMLRQGGGAIINISSLAAIRWTGYPYFAYAATKAAVNQATVALAMQYARSNIRANCIMPGLIDTPLIYKQISGQYASVDDMVAARNAAVPIGRMGTAWDIANAAVFLASDEAQFITGVCLPVDGDRAAQWRRWTRIRSSSTTMSANPWLLHAGTPCIDPGGGVTYRPSAAAQRWRWARR